MNAIEMTRPVTDAHAFTALVSTILKGSLQMPGGESPGPRRQYNTRLSYLTIGLKMIDFTSLDGLDREQKLSSLVTP